MKGYLARRLVYLVAVLVAVTFAVSAMLELLPGDPAEVLIGENATPEQIAAVRQELHLDDSMVTRYVRWVGGALHGDFGRSPRTGLTVGSQIKDRFPVSLEILVLGQAVALLYAVAAGVYAANRPGRVVDTASTLASFGMLSVPSFVVGLDLLRLFAVQVQWFPVGGFTRISENLAENLKSVTLPVLAIAADPAAIYQRLLRSDMRRTLDEDYVLMAEAKGLSNARVLFRHSLRPSTFSLVTLIGIFTARLIGGSVVIETIFGLPGLGKMLIDAIENRDFVVVQGVVAVIALGYVAINTVIDMLYGFLDPRVRRER